MKCNVDVVRIRENSIQLNGWAIGKTPETEITYQVEDGAHQPIRFQYVATRNAIAAHPAFALIDRMKMGIGHPCGIKVD